MAAYIIMDGVSAGDFMKGVKGDLASASASQTPVASTLQMHWIFGYLPFLKGNL